MAQEKCLTVRMSFVSKSLNCQYSLHAICIEGRDSLRPGGKTNQLNPLSAGPHFPCRG